VSSSLKAYDATKGYITSDAVKHDLKSTVVIKSNAENKLILARNELYCRKLRGFSKDKSYLLQVLHECLFKGR